MCSCVHVSATFGSFHQFELHHSVTSSFLSSDVETDHGAGLLQGLHSSTVGHIPHVQLVHSEDDVINPETHDSGCSSGGVTFHRGSGSS